MFTQVYEKLSDARAYVAQQVLQVVVGGALLLVLGQLLHVAVQAEVQPSQLLLHLPHVLQLLEGAHLPWKPDEVKLLNFPDPPVWLPED